MIKPLSLSLALLSLSLMTGCQAATPAPTLPPATATISPQPIEPQPKPEIVPEPEPTPVESLLERMTTEEKIGQLFMADFRSNEDGSDMLTLSTTARCQISDYHLGGVILFGENLDTTEQTTALISEMQDASNLPLLIGIDEEGGIVSRLNYSQIPHKDIPSAGNISTDEEVVQSATSIGETLSSLGIQVDFAPVADVNTNPKNPVIGMRSYSSDPKIASERVTTFISALQDTGVAAVAKHFPGHGDTATDTHTGSAVVNKDLQQLESTEFLPFQAAIEHGVDMVLVGHIQLPQVTGDDIPATLNPKIIDLLRTNLGYDGIAVTDAMNMGAITDTYGAGQSAVMAIEAGIDIVLMPADLPVAFQAVAEAVADGTITQENLEDSVTRVLQLKYDMGLLN